ncbi:MAG: hypothetical protein JSV34_03535 [Candidatus Omnitrophota bacterium]|nr:MAG: hypothetical protein JSV34_03535 [Candidatus Omnitrophota bacterium]
MGNKKILISVLVILSLLVLILGIRYTKSRLSHKEVKEKQPSIEKTIPVQKKVYEKRLKIKPIIVREEPSMRKPDSIEAGEWNLYSQEVVSKIKSEMSPQLIEKIIEERNKRKDPGVEENIKKLDEEISRLQEEAVKSGDRETREKLRKLLDVRSKYKYLQENFL